MSALPRGVPDILPPGSLLADVPMEDVAGAVKELIKQGRVNGDGLRHMRVHGIHAIEEMAQQRVASKLSAYGIS